MKKRDRRTTPTSTSLAAGWTEAVPESMEVKPDTSSAFYLDGEGTSKSGQKQKDKHFDRIISSKSSTNKMSENKSNKLSSNIRNTVPVYGPDRKRMKNTNESRARKWIKQGKAKEIIIETKNAKTNKSKKIFCIWLLEKPIGNIRVPVLSPDGKPLMPTKSSRARKWLRDGKAKVIPNDLGIFQIQLIQEPSGRNHQDIVVTNDPGSKFTGVAVCSNKSVLYGCNLELIVDEKENRFASIKNRMDKRRELRRSRRHRNCRRREARFLNRSKTGKMAPSIRSRKQLELRVNKELTKIYPITVAGIEDVTFDHYNKRWGKNFSQVEVGKKWLYEEMKNIPDIREVKLIKGYETSVRRKQLNLQKSSKKEERNPISHVNDCISMGSIILGLGMETKSVLRQGINFDIITRPKYSRRKLYNEEPHKKPNKEGIRRRFGGTTTNWTNMRKGDYVETIIDKRSGKDMMYRGWVGGFENDKKLISVYDFDWKVVGQFDSRKVRLLDRNNGLLLKSLEISKDRIEICKFGTTQTGIEDAWR